MLQPVILVQEIFTDTRIDGLATIISQTGISFAVSRLMRETRVVKKALIGFVSFVFDPLRLTKGDA